jgi:hypothetical protein
MHVELADQDGSGRFEPAGHFGVLRGNPVRKDGTGGGGPYARRIQVVFQCHRNAVERALPSPALNVFCRLVGLRQRCFAGHGDEGIENGIVQLNAAQARVRQVQRRDRPLAD